MRTIAITLIIGAVMLCGVVASELSPEQREALNTAERHWEQGNFTEVETTLQVLRNPENDAALQRQVGTFLESQSSERAVMTALMMDNQEMRNNTLFRILNAQLWAAGYKPHEFDMMLGKAEITALFLTGTFRDAGYGSIAASYFRAGKSDLAWQAVEKIDVERYVGALEGFHRAIYSAPVTNETMTGNAVRFRELVDTIESPQIRAMMLLNLVVLYTERTDEKLSLLSGSFGVHHARITRISDTLKAELREKRLEVLDEALALILSLPDTTDKVRQLQRVRIFYRADHHRDKSEALSPVILATIGNIENAQARFSLYSELFHPTLPNAREILGKMHAIAEETDTAANWLALLRSYSWSVRPEQPDSLEILDKMLAIADRSKQDEFWQTFFRSGLRSAPFVDKPHADALLDKMQAISDRLENGSQFIKDFQIRLFPQYLSTLISVSEHWERLDKPEAVEIFEKMLALVEKTDSHSQWNSLMTIAPRMPGMTSERLNELDTRRNNAFNRMRQTAQNISDPRRRIESLRHHVRRHPNPREQDHVLLKDIVEIILSTDGDISRVFPQHEIQSVMFRLRDNGLVQEAAELALSPRIPDAWKPDFARIALQMLRNINATELEAQKDGIQTLIDSIPSVQRIPEVNEINRLLERFNTSREGL